MANNNEENLIVHSFSTLRYAISGRTFFNPQVRNFRKNQNQETNWPSFNIEQWRIERKYNERALFKSIEEFDVERKESIRWLKGIENPDLNLEHSGNGFEGQKMKAGDVIAAWIAHDFFHIRQLALAKWYILNESVKPFSSSYSGFYE